MPRPSRNIDRRLLAAARQLLPRTGITGLKVRAVARRARVNLGMFHYHFRSKDQFVRRLLQESYEEFFGRLTLESGGPGPPLERLRRAVRVMARFARANRRLIMTLLREVLNGERAAIAFAKANVPRHVSVLLGLVRECRAAGAIAPLPPPAVLAFLLGGMGAPNAVVTVLERAGAKRPFGRSVREVERLFLSDRAIERRLTLLIFALSAPAAGRRRP